jgi:hypothetical protein
MEAVILSPDEYQRIKDFMKVQELNRDAQEALQSKGFKNGRDLANHLLKN